ncbi:MAG: hypothetical protein CR993_03235 [Rhodobacterales bacterium]|nr:MAG: hypothetical protein CR993_03235 [Rhodobacterales bacterium]
MSDYLHFTLNFTIRRDTPIALQNALSALAARRLPDEGDLSALPELVAEYLRLPDVPEGLDGDGFTYRYSRSGTPFHIENPGDPTHHVHVERRFHDDEYYNGGMYFIYWLFQFAARDGHLAVEQLEFDTPPTIYTRYGDEILITRLAYNPEEYRPLAYRQTPLDAESPIVVVETIRQNLTELLDGLRAMIDAS